MSERDVELAARATLVRLRRVRVHLYRIARGTEAERDIAESIIALASALATIATPERDDEPTRDEKLKERR